MHIDKKLACTDSLIVLAVGEFIDSKVKQIFKANFINLLTTNTYDNALKLLEYNHIDIVLCDKSSMSDTYKIIEFAHTFNSACLCMISSNSLDIDDLLLCIDLKIDAHLYEYDETSKLYEQLDTLVTRYSKENNLRYFEEFFNEACHDVLVSKTDEKGYITYVNQEFCHSTGYSYTELIGQNHNIIRHEDNKISLFRNLWQTIQTEQNTWTGVIKNQGKHNLPFYAQSIIIPILNEHKETIEYLGLRINISKMFCDQSKLLYTIDSHELSVLALIQIKEFDVLEDLYKNGLIEAIEKRFGEQLLEHLPKSSLPKNVFKEIFFLGQGQYALHCDFHHFLHNNVHLEKFFQQFVYNINHSILEMSFFEENIQIGLSFAYGKENLFNDAHYGLKKALKYNQNVFDANDVHIKQQSFYKENKDMMKTIKIALDNANVVSYFQPIINNKTKKIDKYESLVRLIDDEDNIISPNLFLKTAKKSHYYNKITQEVLKNSFKTLSTVTQDISINFCMSDIEQKDTTDAFFSLLEENRSFANRLIIELLEDEDIKNEDLIVAFILKLKKIGVKVAIDDFGSGYSNFERILTLNPDIIKIDGSLVKNIETDKVARNLIETICFLCKKQNIQTVAEYVENENIYKILTKIGIDYSQGYYFGKPQHLLT